MRGAVTIAIGLVVAAAITALGILLSVLLAMPFDGRLLTRVEGLSMPAGVLSFQSTLVYLPIYAVVVTPRARASDWPRSLLARPVRRPLLLSRGGFGARLVVVLAIGPVRGLGRLIATGIAVKNCCSILPRDLLRAGLWAPTTDNGTDRAGTNE